VRKQKMRASKKLFFSRREEAAVYPLGECSYFTTNGLLKKYFVSFPQHADYKKPRKMRAAQRRPYTNR